MPIKLNVNARTMTVRSEADTPLLWVLRDELGLTGTKFGCGIASCGACTVHIDGQPTRSCSIPVDSVGEGKVMTIDGLSSAVATAVKDSWIAHEVAQCGYCQSGQIMSAIALLQVNPKPEDADIDGAMSGNICRCATYQRIRQAIHTAAGTLEGMNL